MTDPNLNGGPDGRQQQPHRQAQQEHPQAQQQPYPQGQQYPQQQHLQQQHLQHPQPPYGQQQAYAPEPYAQQGHAAQPHAPGQGYAPGQEQYGQPGQEQHGRPQHGQHRRHGQPPYGQPPADDAATALLPPVPPMDDAAATTLLPPVVVSGAMPTAAQAQVQAQAQAPVFDPPTMTLKRPAAPAAHGAPYAAVPAQPVPAAAAPTGPTGPTAVPARAPRTGSPIIDPGLQPALITAAVAALLAGGAALGQVALALVVAALQALTAAGWFRLNGMWPARQGIALAALAGLTADVAVLLADSDGGAAAVAGTLGGFFLLVLVLQTFRPSDPKERFYALTVLGSATVVTVLCTTLLLADWVPAAVGAVALATVLAAAPLPGPKQLGPVPVGWVLGLVAAVVFGLVVGAPPVLGVLAGLGALVGRRVAGYDFPSRFVHMTAGVALPLAVASPLVWIATRLLAG
ncbi:hypothetical protein OG535_22010 [Kitasatospora sp. NBC_00085]|uniref:hypothetical protein n=1 Tax=unclassified Kitasatospora TaxID=2633591 RepID=UPI003245250F